MRFPGGMYPSSGGRGKFRMLPIAVLLIFGAVYFVSHKQTVPFTGRTQVVDIGRDEELALGIQSYRQILSQERVIKSGPEVELVRSVGQKIAQVVEDDGFAWEFNLIDSPQPNAFCLPGGKVAVYTGILPITQNADGLAVVMGHEIAHAIARHGAERMAHEKLAQWGQLAVGMAASDMDMQQRRMVLGAFGMGANLGVLLPFSRSHESEADEIGLILMARACFDPTEAPHFWERMQQAKSGGGAPPEFLSTHPSDGTRVAALRELGARALEERARYCAK